MANKIDIVIAARDQATEIIKSVNSQVSILAETLGLVGLASAGFAGFAASKEFVELEKAAKRLDPALRDLARSMEIGTNVDEKTILGLMDRIQKRGFATDQIDDAAKAAMGLSEVMGITLNEALSEVKAAAEGNFTALEYLIPNINQLASSEEKLAAVSKLASQGLQEKADIANSAVSVFDRMNTEMGNLQATVGEIIEPFRQLAFEGIAVTAEMLSQALTPAIEDFESKFAGMGDSVDATSKWITENIVGTFTMAEVVVDQFGTAMEGFGAALLLPLEQARSGWEYFFLDLIPSLANWLGENIYEIFYDLGEGIITVFTNLGTSIGEIMAGVWNYIAEGFSADAYEQLMFEMGRAGERGFLEGFEGVTKAFEVPPVRISEFEKTLQSISDGAAASILTSFDSKFTERMDAITRGLKDNPLEASIDLKTKGNPLGGMSSEVKMLQAVESRVLVRGSTDDPLLSISKEQANLLRELINLATRQADKTNQQVFLEPVL